VPRGVSGREVIKKGAVINPSPDSVSMVFLLVWSSQIHRFLVTGPLIHALRIVREYGATINIAIGAKGWHCYKLQAYKNPNTGMQNLYGRLSVRIRPPIQNLDSSVRVLYACNLWNTSWGQFL